MRRVPLVLLLAIAGLVAPAHASAADRCASKGRTERLTHKVRLYWARYSMGGDRGSALYGCVRHTGETTPLFYVSFAIGNYYQGIAHLRVNRYWVAFSSYAWSSVDKRKASDDAVHLVQLRTGKHRVLGRVRDYDRHRHGARVDGLVLDPCGRVAYRARLTEAALGRPERAPARLLTWIRGRRHLVDRRGADGGSVHFARRSLHWTRGGVERSAAAAHC